MRMSDIPFGTTDWAAITPTEHPRGRAAMPTGAVTRPALDS